MSKKEERKIGNPIKWLVEQLSNAKYIIHPTQLFALGIFSLVALWALSVMYGRNVEYASFILIVILCLYVLGFRSTESKETVTEIPTDLKVEDELFNRIVRPLNDMNIQITHSVSTTKWEKTYYYTKGLLNKRVFGLISLDQVFFHDKESWRKGLWFSYILDIPNKPFSDLIVFSNTEYICQEALYEINDIKKRKNIDIILVTKIYLNEFKKAATTSDEIKDVFKLLLSL